MKKALNIIESVVTWILVGSAIAMMIFTVVSVNTFDRNDRSLFGYKAYIVRSDSMSKSNIHAGDLIFVKSIDPTTLVEGDIISYQSTNIDNYGETITHKIRKRTVDEQGNSGFITYGTTTGIDDDNIVLYEFVLGKYETRLPKVGTFFLFLKTTPGYMVCIFLPFLLLIVMQGINSIRLFRRYKTEQMAELEEQRKRERKEIEAERAKLEEERKKSEAMLAELLKMRNAIENMGGNISTPTEK